MGITAQEAAEILDTIYTKKTLTALIDKLDTVGHKKIKQASGYQTHHLYEVKSVVIKYEIYVLIRIRNNQYKYDKI